MVLSARMISQQIGLRHTIKLKINTEIQLTLLSEAKDTEVFLGGGVEIDESNLGG